MDGNISYHLPGESSDAMPDVPACTDALLHQEGGSHYKDMPIQPALFCERNGLSFLESCVVKRMCRWRRKDGILDLQKAIHEIKLLIAFQENTVNTDALITNH
jgi:hypothetical protein